MVPIQIGGIPGGFELLIVGTIWIIVPLALAYHVYTDGVKRGEGKPELWALAVAGLGYLTLFGAVAAYAIYVWQRE
jgi:hypothetical protein